MIIHQNDSNHDSYKIYKKKNMDHQIPCQNSKR